MKKSSYILRSLVNALGVVIYVSLIAFFFSHATILDKTTNTFLTPVLMLLLLIISASITGSLVFGKPITMYWDGHKKEAVTMLFTTLGWLVVFLLILVIALLPR